MACGVCRKGAGRNSIFCPTCKSWIHAKCSGITGKLSKDVDFVGSRCQNGTGNNKNITKKVVLAASSLEVVNRFCYLGDMLDSSGDAESSTVTRVRCEWNKFRELLPLVTA